MTIPDLLLKLLTRIPEDIPSSEILVFLDEIRKNTESMQIQANQNRANQNYKKQWYVFSFIGKCFDFDRIQYWLMANLTDTRNRPLSCAENMARGHWFQNELNLSVLSEPMIARIRERFYGRTLSEIDKKDIFNFIWRIYLEYRPGHRDYDLF